MSFPETPLKVGFEVLTAVSMKMAVVWAVALSTILHGATTQKTANFKFLSK
jgi:accessory gene regulator protein AgrB